MAIDADGNIVHVDPEKLANIAPNKIELSMADPALRKMVVTRI